MKPGHRNQTNSQSTYKQPFSCWSSSSLVHKQCLYYTFRIFLDKSRPICLKHVNRNVVLDNSIIQNRYGNYRGRVYQCVQSICFTIPAIIKMYIKSFNFPALLYSALPEMNHRMYKRWFRLTRSSTYIINKSRSSRTDSMFSCLDIKLWSNVTP